MSLPHARPAHTPINTSDPVIVDRMWLHGQMARLNTEGIVAQMADFHCPYIYPKSLCNITMTSSFSCSRPVKVNTCQLIPVTAHVGSLLRGFLRFTCFPEIKRKQNKLLIFKTPTC